MSYIVRQVTVSKAETLYQDLAQNLGHVYEYEGNLYQYTNDLELFALLGMYLMKEREAEGNETKMDGQNGEFPDEE